MILRTTQSFTIAHVVRRRPLGTAPESARFRVPGDVAGSGDLYDLVLVPREMLESADEERIGHWFEAEVAPRVRPGGEVVVVG
jgi:hypothetical protein